MAEAQAVADPKPAAPVAADPKAAPVPAPAPAPAEDPIAKGLETIADRERAHRRTVERFEASQKAAESELTAARELLALRAEYKKTRDPRIGAKILEYEDAKEVVRDWAVRLHNEDKPKTAEDRIKLAEERAAAIEARLDAKEKQELAARNAAAMADQEAQNNAARSEHRQQIAAFITEKESDYPFLAAQKTPGQEVSDRIWDHWIKTYDKETEKGELLKREDVAAILELNLVEQAQRAEAIRAKHKKQPEPAPALPKAPVPVVKAAVPAAGEESGPGAKSEPDRAEIDFDTADLDKIDPDSLSDAERHLFVLARFNRGFAKK